MTEKFNAFCREYILDFNATQAAIRAGYSEKTAGSIGSEILKKPETKEFLANIVSEALENTKFKLEKVIIDKCFAIITANITDYITKDGNITNWDTLDKRPVKSIKRKLNARGDETIEIELHDPKPYMDLLSKYIDLAGSKDSTITNIIYLDKDAETKGF